MAELEEEEIMEDMMIDEEMMMNSQLDDYCYNGKITSDKPLVLQSESPFHIIKLTSLSFGTSVKTGSRTVIQLQTVLDEEKHVIGVLNEGNQETLQCDLLINPGSTLSLAGTKVSQVHVNGYYSPLSAHACDEQTKARVMNELVMARAEEEEDMDDDEDAELDADEEAEMVREIEQRVADQRGKKKRSRQAMADSDEDRPIESGQSRREEEAKEAPPKKKNKNVWIDLGDGLEYKDVKLGRGRPAKKGDTAVVYYVGQLPNKKVFDKCISGEGFSFTIGSGEVIDGWDLGIDGMQVGTKRRLRIPADLAYGAAGSPPEIPGKTDLNFTVELRALK